MINYIKAKSTLRHIYMIQMCVCNSILAGRLEDCWLAPGRLLAATAGCTRRLLAGPWEGCWPLGDCWVCWNRWICWFLVLLPGGWSSKLMLIFRLPSRRGRSWELMLIFQLPSRIWLETVVTPLRSVRKSAGNSVDGVLFSRRSQYGYQCSKWAILQVENTGFNQFKRNFVDIYDKTGSIHRSVSPLLTFSKPLGSYLMVVLGFSQFWTGSS